MNRYNRPYLAGAENTSGCGCGQGEEAAERGCGQDNPCAGCLPLAIAAILPQPFENLHDYMTGWQRGTIFIDLDKPYTGGCCR